MKRFNKVIATVLCLVLVMSTVSVAQAAKKIQKVQKIKIVDDLGPVKALMLTTEDPTYHDYTVTVKFTPSKSKSKVTWKSSNPEIAKVDQNGKVTAVSTGDNTVTVTNDKGHKFTCNVGKTTITVTTANGKSATCKVEVYRTFDDHTIVQAPYMMDELLKDKEEKE